MKKNHYSDSGDSAHTESYFFITGNAGKFKEIQQSIPQILQLDIDLKEIQSTSGKTVIHEKIKEAFHELGEKIANRMKGSFKSVHDKETFIRNAELAQNALKRGSAHIIIEDTSLYFEALANKNAQTSSPDDIPNGLPGPLIKFFMETMGNDGLYRLAQTFGNQAKAVTWIGCSHDGNDIRYFTGEVSGEIVKSIGLEGFGWDTIFKPHGATQTFAQMTPEEKDQYSMRAIAAAKLKTCLENRSLYPYI